MDDKMMVQKHAGSFHKDGKNISLWMSLTETMVDLRTIWIVSRKVWINEFVEFSFSVINTNDRYDALKTFIDMTEKEIAVIKEENKD